MSWHFGGSRLKRPQRVDHLRDKARPVWHNVNRRTSRFHDANVVNDTFLAAGALERSDTVPVFAIVTEETVAQFGSIVTAQ